MAPDENPDPGLPLHVEKSDLLTGNEFDESHVYVDVDGGPQISLNQFSPERVNSLSGRKTERPIPPTSPRDHDVSWRERHAYR